MNYIFTTLTMLTGFNVILIPFILGITINSCFRKQKNDLLVAVSILIAQLIFSAAIILLNYIQSEPIEWGMLLKYKVMIPIFLIGLFHNVIFDIKESHKIVPEQK